MLKLNRKIRIARNVKLTNAGQLTSTASKTVSLKAPSAIGTAPGAWTTARHDPAVSLRDGKIGGK